MARVILSNNETFTVFNSTASVEGGTGTETLLIGGTSSAVTVSQSIERVDLKGNVGDYTYQAAGNQVKVYSGGALVATITAQDDSNGTQVAFADGSAYLTVTALNAASLGSAAIGTTAVAVSSSQVGSTFDTTTKSGSTALGGTTNTNQTFTLTTGVNTMTGGTGNDFYDGSTVSTLNSYDTLDGGAGTDTLYATLAAGTISPTISNIEALQFATSASASSTAAVDLLGASGYTSIENTGSTGALKVSNIASTASTTKISNVTGTSTEFAWQTAVVDGTSDSISLTLSNVTSNGGTASTMTIAGVETVNIASTTLPNAIDLTNVSATTVNVTGSQALTVSALNAATTKLSASGFSGALKATLGAANASVVGGTGADSIDATSVTAALSISGGAGSDSINAGAALTTGDSIDGGDGTDTVTTTTAALQVFTGATITNVEALALTTALTGTVTLSAVGTGITTLSVPVASGVGTGSVGGNAGTLVLNLGTSSATAGLSGGLTITTAASTGTADALTINNLAVAASGLNFNVLNGQAITDTGYESVTIDTGAVAGGATTTISTLTVNADTATVGTSVTLTGKNSATIISLVTNSTGNLTVDASALGTGAVLTLSGTTSGTAGTQSIKGSAGADRVTVGNFAAYIDGSAGANTITGGTASDTITAGSGADSIVGNGGNDSISAGDGANSIAGGAGNDTITAGIGADTIVGNNGNDSISAGDGANSVTGGTGNDTITAGIGADTIVGNNGNDSITAGDGANSITAGSGNDTINAGVGADTIVGNNGNDSISAGDGANSITGGTGNDTITAGSGVDTIVGNGGNDSISAGDGANTITTGSGNATITAGIGADSITTGTGSNSVDAGAGNDTIVAGAGNDNLSGGDGDDTYTMGGNLSSQDVITDSSGTDTLTAALSSAAISPAISNIEAINLSLIGTNKVDATGFAGATTVSVTGASPASLEITGLVGGTELGLGYTGAVTFGGTLTFGLRDTTGSSDSVKFKLNNTADNGLNSTTLVTSGTAGAIETVILNVGATAGAILGVASLATPTISVTGGLSGKTLDLTGGTTLSTTTTAVNASSFSGRLVAAAGASVGTSFSVTGAAGNDSLTGGTGNDSFTIASANASSAFSIDGGTGTDTLNVTMAAGSTGFRVSQISGIENINISIQTTDALFTAPTSLGNSTTNALSDSALTNLVITGGTSASKLTLGGAATGPIGGALATTATPSATQITKIDASGYAGTVDATVVLDALYAGHTMTGGSGSADVLRYTNTFGNSTTGITAGSVSGFESIFVTTEGDGNGSHNLANVSGVNTITVLGSESYALTQLGAGIALKIGDDSTGGVGFVDGKTLSASLATSSASDAVTVNLGKVNSASTGVTLTLPGIETITLNQSSLSNGSAFALLISDTSTNSVTINATGGLAGRDLSFVSSGLKANVSTINGTGFAGNLLMADSSRVGTTAMSITGGSGNDLVIMKNASDTITGGSGTDTLKIAANASGAFTFDLSSSTDQVVTWNGFANSAAQSGFENLNASTLVGAVGIGVLASSASGSNIVGTGNSDTVYGGAGDDTITLGNGADSIDVSSGGTDTIVYSATGQTQTNVTTNAAIQDGDYIGDKVDVITGLARGDNIDLSGISPVPQTTGFDFGFLTTGILGDGNSDMYQMAKGDYVGIGLWTFSSTGSDVLFQWDSNGSLAGGVESVVLVGSASSFTGITANSAGVILFT
jgi:Ca2+-binding RTX toxin-like protein